jgi:hypothetical protein
VNSSNPITNVSMARGRFDGSGHDQLAIAFATNSGPCSVEIIDFKANSLTPIEASPLTVSTVAIPAGYLQVQTGAFALPGNPYDQIVFHTSSSNSGGKFFEVLSVNPIDLTLSAHSPITYNQLPCAAPNGVQVGNFDHRQANEHNPNSQIAFLACDSNATSSTLSIYSVDPATLNVQGTPDSSFPLSVSAQNVSFLASDIQGRSMLLGEPTKVTISHSSPSIVTAAPPMHVDYITPVGGTRPEVLNISFIPDGFNSSFDLSQESKTGGSTTGKLSWSAGVDLSASGEFRIGDPDAGTGATFSAGFHAADDLVRSSDNSTVNYEASSYQISTTTKKGDVLFSNESRQNIWVYPVIGQQACPATFPNCPAYALKPLTIQFSGPDQIDTGDATPAEDFGAFWYQPPWEWGNIFSYPATQEQLALIYPDVAKTQLSSNMSFKPSQSSINIQATWSSGTEEGLTTSLANTTSFDTTTSYAQSVGISNIAQGTISASLKLSGSVGFEHLQENTAQVDASNGIGILSTANFPDTSNYGYKVKTYILASSPPSGVGDSQQPPQANIQQFGPLKTAFSADPIDVNDGGAWWSQASAYGSAPDIALNHPSRWVLTTPGAPSVIPPNCGSPSTSSSQIDCVDIAPYYDQSNPPKPLNPWLSNSYSMRGFFITSADNPGAGPQLGFATAGDKLDLAVRVYNYSLAPVVEGNRVHVRFYAMPWDQLNGAQAGDSILIGENTVDPIPPFSDTAGAPLNWTVVHAPTAFDTSRYAGDFFAFWVVVWMEDGSGGLVKEIEGHGLTSIPSTLTKPSDVQLEMAQAVDGTTTVSYSNNVGFYHYAFPVLAPQPELGAPAPENPADITLKHVSTAKKRVRAGELDEITAVLRAETEAARRLKVYFYDGDPDADGKLIGTEIAQFEPRTITKVRFPYHPPSDGIHRIWAVINKGKPYQTERHTSAIIVGHAEPDRNNSDGDNPPNDRAAQ